MSYEAVIGMEVHVELRTDSKMFCPCPAEHFQVTANEHVCPVCTAQPGSLPVINARAVELTVMTGLALNCQIQRQSIFARKNYSYPDLPKGYQISQYEEPLCLDGWTEIEVGGERKRIGIVRVHLEEDTGKLQHEGKASLVDYNRAGVPLMEIVSDASIRSADEAFDYLQKIRRIVRYLSASTGDMEKGAMRCEANISVRRVGAEEFGTKVEVKNLNSFRSVKSSIDYEMRRQIETLEDGGEVRQVTMGWDETAGHTREQRSKEYDDDYRYFPEPDLLRVDLSDESIEEIRTSLPELPDARANRFETQYGLGSQEADLLVDDESTADYFESVIEADIDPKQVSNWVTGEVFRRLREDGTSIEEISVKPQSLAELLRLVDEGTINQTAAKEVFGVMWSRSGSPGSLVEELQLSQISDTSELDAAVAQVIEENPDATNKIAAGNDKPIQFLMGQVMKATRGKANPQVVQELLRKQILD